MCEVIQGHWNQGRVCIPAIFPSFGFAEFLGHRVAAEPVDEEDDIDLLFDKIVLSLYEVKQGFMGGGQDIVDDNLSADFAGQDVVPLFGDFL